ncbi:MAG TPA: hypothetical protein VG943_17885 [Caulobacterales bacterium]|nr:hypothetical protein [Caulobacterales bacterium]
MTDQTSNAPSITADAGRATALVVYVLYLLSIPSFALFALIGVIIAYMSRGGALGLGRAHLEDQIRIWWIAFLWGVAIFVLTIVGWILSPVLIGFPLLWLAWVVGFVVMLWFTVKSAFGLIALLEGRQVGGWLS